LFSPYNTGTSRGRGRRVQPSSKGRSWTMNVVCLASKYAITVPTALEKVELSNAGLGFNKVQVFLTDGEEMVLHKISEVFPKIKEGGGIELLACKPHSKDLIVLQTSMAAKDLKTALGGGQSKIYVRPIQKSLSTAAGCRKKSELKEKCHHCSQLISIHELRDHTIDCSENGNSSFDEEILTQPVFRNSQPSRSGSSMSPTIVPPSSSTLTSSPSSSLPSSPPPSPPPPPSSPVSSSTLLPSPPQNLAINSTIEEGSSDKNLDLILKEVVEYCQSKNLQQNPIEVLRCFQKKMITGRPLEISEMSECPEGNTSFILVNRYDILLSGLSELKSIHRRDRNMTLEVQFSNEVISLNSKLNSWVLINFAICFNLFPYLQNQ